MDEIHIETRPEERTLLGENTIRILEAISIKPKSLRELSKELKLHNHSVSWLLMNLEQINVVKGNYQIVKQPTDTTKGRASKFYSINQTGLAKAVKAIERLTNRIRRVQK